MFEFANHGIAILGAAAMVAIAAGSIGAVIAGIVGLIANFAKATGTKLGFIVLGVLFFFVSLVMLAEIDCSTDFWPYHALYDAADAERCVHQHGTSEALQ